ncbi:hypothetical protein L6164_033477 [Bauhinia variegata]|uniref:Uncharacterized protein n=1 Tax=Bauhinia variegata TaxID=167791 RepID=A0ACB9KS13_BAUVA|nr:hypothetical protein L6164_033477 [Bauhinia variegata]
MSQFEGHQWSSGRIVPCHGTDPGSIPGCFDKIDGRDEEGQLRIDDSRPITTTEGLNAENPSPNQDATKEYKFL